MNIPISLAIIISAAIVAIVAIDSVKDFLLKKEKIKSDALVRIEETKARNQLELEKLIKEDNINTNLNDRLSDYEDNRTVKEKVNS